MPGRQGRCKMRLGGQGRVIAARRCNAVLLDKARYPLVFRQPAAPSVASTAHPLEDNRDRQMEPTALSPQQL